MADNCTGFDIVGVGVRLTIYVQSLVVLLNSALVAIMSWGHPSRGAERVAHTRHILLVTSCFVLLNALAKAWHGQLTLAHMLVVLRLAWLASYAAHTAVMTTWLHVNSDLWYPLYLGDASPFAKPAPLHAVSESGKRIKPPVLRCGRATKLHLTFMGAVGFFVFTCPSRFSTDTCGAVGSIALPSLHRRIFWLLVYTACMVTSYNHAFVFMSMLPVVGVIDVGSKIFSVLCLGHRVTMEEYATRSGHLALASGLVIVGVITASAEVAMGGAKQWTLGQALVLLLAVPGLRTIYWGVGRKSEVKQDKSQGAQSLQP